MLAAVDEHWKPWSAEWGRYKVSNHPGVWGSLEWADATAVLRKKSHALLMRLTQEGVLLQVARCHFLYILFYNDPLKAKRFSSLRGHIMVDLLPNLLENAMADVQPKLERLVEFILAPFYLTLDMSAETKLTIESLDRALVGCILSHFMQAIQAEKQQSHIMIMPATFQLEEDKEVQEQRAALHADIVKLMKAHEQISHIEDAFSAPVSPPAAALSGVNHAFHPSEPELVHDGNTKTVALRPAVDDASGITAPPAVLVSSVSKVAVVEAAMEDIPMSPAVSIADSFVHVHE